MRHAKFPARKADGSFCIEIGVRMAGDLSVDAVPRIQQWISGVWMPHHMTWTREWRTGSNFATSKEQILNYSDEFAAPPEVSLGPASELRLRLKGNKTAKFWRDWVASRIVPDLKEAFPGVEDLLYIRNCDE